ncbi:MAG: methyl-accepting chemotaxis protein, partial [Rhizobacter sp.]
MNKFKGWGQKDEAAMAGGAAATFDDLHAATEQPPVEPVSHDVPTQQQATNDTSIITEAAPSEMADFSETRLQEHQAAVAAGTGLPVIGQRPVAEQQRILIVLALVGLLGLVIMTFLSLLSANRGSAQVGA